MWKLGNGHQQHVIPIRHPLFCSYLQSDVIEVIYLGECFTNNDENILSCCLFRYLKELDDKGQISRIVFDEIHVYLTQEFRDRLVNITGLATLKAPRLGLSATIPPVVASEIMACVGIPETQHVIREPSVQPNVQYYILQAEDAAEAKRMASTLLAFGRKEYHGQPESQGMLFSPDKDLSEEIGKKNGLPVYHSKMGMEGETALREWLGLETPVISTCSGLSTGIDQPYVDFIIFVGCPWGLIDYYQSSGRCARKGRKALSILINVRKERRTVKEHDVQMMKEMLEMAQDKHRCDREFLTLHMDGEGLCCADLPEADPCRKCHNNGTEIRIDRAVHKVSNHYREPFVPRAAYPVAQKRRQPEETSGHPSKRRKHGHQHTESTSSILSVSSSSNSMIIATGVALKMQKREVLMTTVSSALQHFSGKCLMCLLLDGKSDVKEKDFRCCSPCLSRFNQLERAEGVSFKEWRKTHFRYSKEKKNRFIVCFSCHVFQDAFEPQLHKFPKKKKDEEKQRHEYADIIPRALFILKAAKRIGQLSSWHEFGLEMLEPTEAYNNALDMFADAFLSL